MNIAICEDEKPAVEVLVNFINKYFKDTDTEYSYDVYSGGSEMLMNFRSQYDIVFMDVQMPGMDGMETAKALRKTDGNFCLIFVTNMASVAINGYKVDAIDFLVKPVSYFQFQNAIKKAINICVKNSSSYIILDLTATESRKVFIKDILYVEVYGHTLNYHLFNESLTLRYVTMKEVEKQLEGFGFARCDNCYLVNMRYITAINKNTVTVNGTELKISRTRRKEFIIEFTKFMGGGGKL